MTNGIRSVTGGEPKRISGSPIRASAAAAVTLDAMASSEAPGIGQLESPGGCVAVDLGDDRLRAMEDRERRRDVAAEDVAPSEGSRWLRFREVVPGAERPTGAGDGDDADAIVGGGLGDRGREIVAKLRADRIEL